MKFTNQQVDAINHFKGPALILAVPGSGKTTVLLHRILNLIKNYNSELKPLENKSIKGELIKITV